MKTFRTVCAALAVLLAAALAPIPPAAADPLDDARAAGHVGERPDGLLGLVNPGAPAAVKKLMADINRKRMVKYEEIAAQRGTPVAAVQDVVAQKIFGRLPKGSFVLRNGAWVRK